MKKLINKTISGCCSSLIVLGLLVPFSPSAKAVKDFTVEVSPRRVGSIAKYQFHMSFEKKLGVHEWLHIQFPAGTTLTPPIPEDKDARMRRLKEIIESIEFGDPCSACMGLPIIGFEADGRVSFKFHLPTEVDPSIEQFKIITITITEKAGFTNPPLPGSYTFKFMHQQEPVLVESPPVVIADSKITKPRVLVSNPLINQVSQYDIEFITGKAGRLDFLSNTITILFPEGTLIPYPDQTILYQLLQVNNYPILTPPLIEGSKLTILINFKIPDENNVRIHLSSRWGIKNPRNPGKYKFNVYTSTDQEPVESDEIEIKQGPNELQLDIIPAKTNKVAEYTLTFITSKGDLLPGETCQLFFPDLFELPKAIDPQFVRIQGKQVKRVKMDQSLISFELKETIPNGSGVEIKILIGAGIRNPEMPSQVGIRISWLNAKWDLYSGIVDIEQQKVEIKKLQIIPPNELERATYKFTLVFDEELVPAVGDSIEFLFSFLKKPIKLVINQALSDQITLTLPDFQSPPTGRYTVQISTFREGPSKVEEFWIIPARPVSKIVISGGMLGNNGWYTRVPFIGFESSDPDSYFSISFDDPKQFIQLRDGKPRSPEPGQFIAKLYYFATNAYGAEDPKMVEIKVDSVNPEIDKITPEPRKKIETNQKSMKIEGKVSPIKTYVYGEAHIEYFDRDLTIQGKPVNVSKVDGTFSYDASLIEGENEITVHLEDDAGRFTEKIYSVILDSTPPPLEINFPLQNSTILTRKFMFTGKTEPNTFLLINGEFTYVEVDGSFQKQITLFRPGLEHIEIKASDKLDNSVTRIVQFFYGYTIQLWIGKAKVRNNSVEKGIPLAPFIKEGSTMVPFRLIGEELKATILFSTDDKTKQVRKVSYELEGTLILITIGDKRASVNGKEVLMEVPASIVNGFTVVPLRFVTTGLGCNVEWEPTNQMITLQYPGKN